jgi:hypothetical protein
MITFEFKEIAAMPESAEKDFAMWWYNEGSAFYPLHNEDREEHCRRVAKIAWTNATKKSKKIL